MGWSKWIACIGRSDCLTCKEAFSVSVWDTQEDKSRKKNGTPCNTCRPEFWPINEQVLAIYNSCANQVLISGMGGAYAINELAVMNRIKLDGVKRSDQKEVLGLVVMVADSVISLRNEKNRNSRGKS